MNKNDVFENPIENQVELSESEKKNSNFYDKNNHIDGSSNNSSNKNRLADIGQFIVSPDHKKGNFINNRPKPNYHQKKPYGIDYTSNYKYNYQQPYPNEVYFQSQ